MSCDLSIRFPQPVGIEMFVQMSQATLQEVLAVSDVPPLRMTKLDKGARTEGTTGIIGQKGQGFLIGLEGSEEEVGLVIFEMQHGQPYVTAEDAGLWAGISVGALKTPLEFALAAGIAITLARLQGTTVIDEGNFWSQIFEQSCEDFLKVVAVHGVFDDIRSAAAAIYAALPICSGSRT